jgi:hypothetical protein
MNNLLEYEVDEKLNPWAVEKLEDFLFFCCPECPDKCPTRSIFINHALVEHPQVSFKNII